MQAGAQQAMLYSLTSRLYPANPRPLLSRYCQLYGGFPDVDKKQDGILKLSLQKRWVCGQSPEQSLGETRFGSRLPVGLYANLRERLLDFSAAILYYNAERRSSLHARHETWFHPVR